MSSVVVSTSTPETERELLALTRDYELAQEQLPRDKAKAQRSRYVPFARRGAARRTLHVDPRARHSRESVQP